MMALPSPSDLQNDIANSMDQLQKLYPNGFDIKKSFYLPHGKYTFAAGHTFQWKDKLEELRVPYSGPTSFQSTIYARAGIIAGHKVTLSLENARFFWDISKAWREFFRELYFYSHPELLRLLQGIVVPHVIGVHHESDGKKSILMEAPHHISWHTANAHLPISEKERIIQAYDSLHAHGIMHNNISFRNIFIDPDMNVTLVNFESACCLNDKGIDEVPLCDQEALKHEMRQIKYLIDYMGARIMERELLTASQAGASHGVHQLEPLSIWNMDFWDQLTCEYTCTIPSDMRNRPLPNDGRRRTKPLKKGSQKVKVEINQKESPGLSADQVASMSMGSVQDAATSGSQNEPSSLLFTVQPSSSGVTSTPSPPRLPLSPHLDSLPSTSFDEDTADARERDTIMQPPSSEPEVSQALCNSQHNNWSSAFSSTSLLPPSRLPPPILDVPAEPLHTPLSSLLAAYAALPELFDHFHPDRPSSPKVFCDLTHEQLRLAIKQHNAAVDAKLTSQPAINTDKSKVIFHPDTNDNGTYATGSDLFRKRKKRRGPTPFYPDNFYSSEDETNSDEGEEGEELEPGIEVDFEELVEEVQLAKVRSRPRISRPSVLPSMVSAKSLLPKFPGDAQCSSSSTLPLPALSSISEEQSPHDGSETPPYTVIFVGANGSPDEVWQLPVSAFMYIKSLAARQPQAKKLRTEQVPRFQGLPVKNSSLPASPNQNIHGQTSRKRKFDCVEGIEYLERTSKRTRQDSTAGSCIIS